MRTRGRMGLQRIDCSTSTFKVIDKKSCTSIDWKGRSFSQLTHRGTLNPAGSLQYFLQYLLWRL